MEVVLILASAVIIMACVYLGLHTRSPLFVIVVLAAMLAGTLSPLWYWLYGIQYAGGLTYILGNAVPLIALFGGWAVVLPTVITFATLRRRFGQIGYWGGWSVALVYLVIFIFFESIGTKLAIWSYDNEIAAIGFPFNIFMACLHTISAMLLLRAMFEHWRLNIGTTLQIVPIVFAIQLLCYAVIGAPYYIMSSLAGDSWMTIFGFISTMILVLWGIHIVVSGLAELQGPYGQTASMPLIDPAVLAEIERKQSE
jgi:hypothetical protein